MLKWLIAHLLRLQRHLRRRANARRATPRRQDEVEIVLDEDRPLGCGWFDSSHELEHGLLVREADDEALSALPLTDWLALPWQGGVQAELTLV
jgi:hypothetical protein